MARTRNKSSIVDGIKYKMHKSTMNLFQNTLYIAHYTLYKVQIYLCIFFASMLNVA